MLVNNKICGLIGLARRAGKLTFGTEACKQELENKKIKVIIIATDASERTKMEFKNICSKKNVPVFEILDINELSKSIGQNNKAVIGIKDANFSNEIIKIVNGGEAIG